MKRKTLGIGRDRAANCSAKPSGATVRRLANQHDQHHSAVPETSTESDNDLGDDRVADSNEGMAPSKEENCNISPHDLNYIYVDLLDKKICITCNEGGEVLVCCESDCPVALHAKCIHCEPKFDDKGNFYCPYCWYKRALSELQESRKKAIISKKALSNFLDKDMVTGDELLKKVGAAKRKELKGLSLAGDGSCLDGNNRQEKDGVHSQPLQAVGGQQMKTGRAAANADQHGIAVGGEAHANASVANTEYSRHCREEGTPIHIEMAHASMNRDKINVSNISKIDETRFVEGVERTEPEDTRQNNEEVHERMAQFVKEAKRLYASHLGKYTDGHSPDIAFATKFVEGEERTEPEDPRHNNEEVHGRMAEFIEEAKPLCASHLGKYTDGHSSNIAFAKGMQESVAVSADYMDRMEDGEKLLYNEIEIPDTGNSDSILEACSVKKCRVKHKAPKKPYPLKIAPVRAISYKEIETLGKNSCNEIVGDATAETLRQQPHRSSKQDKKLTLTNARRRRLIWTAEEENMLKEGVLKFSMENKNIPWRKILEYGVHVFDQNRTPVDLKDKWKNITVKEAVSLDLGELGTACRMSGIETDVCCAGWK